jgi:cytochrome c-type biogenesis protein CcmH/NrfG
MDTSAVDLSILVGELRSIKVAAYASLAILAVIGIFVSARTALYLRSLVKKEFRDVFDGVARELFQTNDLDALIESALSEIEKRPNQEFAHWWLARAYFMQGRLDDAEAELKITLRLVPDWQERHIDPFVRTIERERGNSAGRVSAP